MSLSSEPLRDALVLRAELSQVSRARDFVAAMAEKAGFSAERRFDIAVASSEACANAIEHSAEVSEVTVEVLVYDDRLEVHVGGGGAFQVPSAGGERRHRGLGLPLMAALTDHLALYSRPDGGTLVQLTFYLPHRLHAPPAERLPPAFVDLLNENRLLDEVLRHLPDGFYILDDDWRFAYVNPAAAAAMHMEVEAVVGRVIWEAFPDYAPDGRHALETARSEGKAVRVTATTSQTQLWREWTAFPVTAGLAVFSRDITAQKQAESELRFQARLLANVGDALIGTDETFNVNYWNKGAERLYGWTSEEAMGRRVEEVVQPGVPVKSREEAIAALAAGGIEDELVFVRKDGTKIPAEIRATMLRGANGEMTGTLSVERDISERVLLDTLLAQTPVALALWRADDLTLQTANAAYLALAPEREMIGKKIMEIWPEAPELEALFRGVASSGQAYEAVDSLFHISRFPGGPLEPRYFTFSLTCVHLPAGGGLGLLNTTVETTERKAADEALRETRERAASERERALCEERQLNEELTVLNEQLSAANSEMASQTEELTVQTEELRVSYDQQQEQMRLSEGLVRVTRELHSLLEPDVVLASAVARGAELLGADTGALSMWQGDGFVISYVSGWPDDFVGRFIPASRDTHGVQAIKTGATLAIDDTHTDPRVRRPLMDEYGVKSVIVAPCYLRGKPLAALYYNFTTARHVFSPGEIHFVTQLALSLSLALENASLYAEQVSLLDRLQRPFLEMPADLPSVEYAAEYRSATIGARIGGDFYDLYVTPDGHLALAVGDVSGHGLEASRYASMVKDSFSLLLMQGRRPRVVLARTNDFLVARGMPGFVTAFLGLLDLHTGELSYASAGHPSPLVATATGEVRGLGLAGSLPLAAFSDSSYAEGRTQLGPGDLLLLYTDGLTEARLGNAFYGEERLAASLAHYKDRPAGELAAALVKRALVFAHGTLHDDAALAVIRFRGPDASSA